MRLSVDAIVKKGDKIVLVRRKYDPFKGMFALPGGTVEKGENTEEAVVREVKEETNLNVKIKKKLGLYYAPNRDPRGPTTTTVFVTEFTSGILKGQSDAIEARWFGIEEINLNNLAFDHAKIIRDYIEQSRKSLHRKTKLI